MYDTPQPDRGFQVSTPVGVLEVYSKHQGKDSDKDFPGVFVDIRRTPAQLSRKEDGDIVCCVEYDSAEKRLQSILYQPSKEEPTHKEVFEPLMTYGDFISRYEDEIVELEVWYEDGSEVPDTVEIPDETLITKISRYSGSFSIDLDMKAPQCPERLPIEMIRRGLLDGVICLELNDEKTRKKTKI